MRSEFKNFFSKKYILIVLAILIFVAIMSWISIVEITPQEQNSLSTSESAYSDFIDSIDIYETQAELKELYEKCGEGVTVPGMESGSNKSYAYERLIYAFSLKNNLPYDSLVEFSEEIKYNQFYYLGSFKIPLMIFILLASIIIGGFYQTADMTNKMSKLIYSSGEKRHKIIDRKYGVSLLSLIGVVTVFESVVALLGLMYCNSGAKYCVVYLGGDTLYYLNYFGYYCLFLATHLVALTVTYTFMYYLSVICKNGIIPVCVMFAVLLISAFLDGPITNNIIYNILTRGGFIEVLFHRDDGSVNLKELCLYIPIAIISVIPLIISRFTIKRADYSR